MKKPVWVAAVMLVLALGMPEARAINWPWKRDKPEEAKPESRKDAANAAAGQRVFDVPRESIEGTLYVPPKAGKIDLPVYPYELLRQRVAGEAAVTCMVGTDGRVVNTRVMRATRPEFGAALAAALEATRFGHGTREGEPIASVMGFRHTFNPRGSETQSLQEELELLERALRRPQTLGKARDLDRPLRAKEQPPPAFPPQLLRQGVEGNALIEFLLDEDGRVRLPRIVSASDPSFGYAAAHAVAQWRFEPPTARGEPTVMRVSIPISFRVN
jgi:TonB family protein